MTVKTLLRANIQVVAKFTDAADVTTALTLRDAIRSFNDAVAKRATLDEGSSAVINRINAVKRELALTRVDPITAECDEARWAICSDVEKFVKLATLRQDVGGDSLSLTIPLVESPTVRRVVAEAGQQIVTRLDAYVNGRRATIQLSDAMRGEKGER